MYYLQSRYYDPAIGRFINADCQFSVIQFLGTNSFAYCFNNPVNNSDPTGRDGILALIFAGGEVLLAAAGSVLFVGGVLLIAGIIDYAIYSASNNSAKNTKDDTPSKKNTNKKGKKESKKSGKESSSDKPSYVNPDMVDKSIGVHQNAKNILDEQFGQGNWKKGPGTDYNKIVKWITRHVMLYWFGEYLQPDDNGDFFIYLY